LRAVRGDAREDREVLAQVGAGVRIAEAVVRGDAVAAGACTGRVVVEIDPEAFEPYLQRRTDVTPQ